MGSGRGKGGKVREGFVMTVNILRLCTSFISTRVDSDVFLIVWVKV